MEEKGRKLFYNYPSKCKILRREFKIWSKINRDGDIFVEGQRRKVIPAVNVLESSALMNTILEEVDF